jgi:hypothetical protein
MLLGIHKLQQLVVDLEVEDGQDLLENALDQLAALHQDHRVGLSVLPWRKRSLIASKEKY